MAEPSTGGPILARPGPLRSLASKFSIFTAALVFWVIATILAYDLRQDTFDVGKGLLLCVIVMLVGSRHLALHHSPAGAAALPASSRHHVRPKRPAWNQSR